MNFLFLMRSLSSLLPLPPELQLIIHRYLTSHLNQIKHNAIISRLESKLYFWLHYETMYHMDYIILQHMDFTDFIPRNTPVGLLRLPHTAYVTLPITPIVILI